MSYLRTTLVPNGDTLSAINYFKCDVTGDEICESEPFFSYGNSFHISFNAMDRVIEDYFLAFKLLYPEASSPLAIHYLLEKFASPKKRNTYLNADLKLLVLKKYNHKCNFCGSKDKLEFDHIHPISKGGLTEVGNLQILCKSCNCKKGDRLM